MNIGIPIEPPADISADALEDYIAEQVRKAMQEVVKFFFCQNSVSQYGGGPVS